MDRTLRPRLVLLAAPLLLWACESSPQASSEVDPEYFAPLNIEADSAFELAGRVTLPEVEPLELEGLHNVYQLSDSILSGAEPESRAALVALQERGIRTILCVDGKVPDVKTARELGMRYVHIPIEYSGIDQDQVLRILKTFRELEGPFYVHCFHGQHRGPAAAAFGRIVIDHVPRERAMAEMRQWSATAPKYQGLFAAVAKMAIPSAAVTEAYEYAFDEASVSTGLQGSMVVMTRKWDLLKAARKRAWQTDLEHPDVAPLQEALQLQQLIEGCAQLEESQAYPEDFQSWLQDNRRGIAELVEALRAGQSAPADLSMEDLREQPWAQRAERAHKLVATSCRDCHVEYRN